MWGLFRCEEVPDEVSFMEQIDKAEFLFNLRLTQMYCEQQLQHTEKNSASILRSINPICNGEPVFKFKLESYGREKENYYFAAGWTVDPFSNSNGFSFAELFQKQLKVKLESNLGWSKQEFDGEILVSEFEQSVTDGAPEAESYGFLDIYDCPPIDTWFYEVERSGCRIFFAWIPRPFVPSASEAIAVSCVDNIKWFEDWSPSEYLAMMG